YFNIQHFEAPGIEWAYEAYFGATGDGYMNAGGDNSSFFTYPHDTWIQLKSIIDLDNDWAEFYIDDVLIQEWQFSLQAQGDPGTLQLGGADLFAGAPTGETAHYYFDDVEYIVLVEGTTPPVITVDSDPVFYNVETGETFEDTFSMSNDGVDDLDYDIIPVYSLGNKSLSQEPAGVHAAKDLNAVLSVDPSPATANNSISDRDEVTLNYDGDNFSAIGSADDYEWRVAARFPADLVKPYIGMELTSVDVYINDPGIDYKLQVYDMGSIHTPGPGDLLHEQTFADNGAAAWVTVTLDSPVYIEGGDIWVGYWLSSIGGLFTPGCDEGPVNPDGDWMAAGPGWGHLSGNPELQYNWNIRANLTGTSSIAWLSTDYTNGTLVQDEVIDVTMTIDATGLESDVYTANLVIRSNDLTNDWITKNVVANITVGINENGEKQYISVYPNPASDYIQVGSNGEISNVTIVNTVGQVVFNQNVGVNTLRVSTESLPNGVYFVNIKTATGTTTQKIVIE
ncbi:MAG: T9SS type A sorting domain-containing protein, partial [Chlorobi bacterium]|nr:T9SS type A sorting domain-containing protein [Chlorobiota bacterium]